jgi:molybdopterin-synthase adenylyltransferase
MALPPERLDRFARHIVLPEVGGAGQVALSQAHVVVIGVGGIGNPALQYLAAAGIGQVTLIDDDAVDLSNLQRQTLFTPAMVEWRGSLDQAIAVVPRQVRIEPPNAAKLIAGADLVVDGSDNFATRLAVSDACVAAGIPLTSGAVGRFQGQVGNFAGHLAGEACYRCFVGDAFDAEDCDTCADDGVLGAFVGTVGAMTAMSAIRVILAGQASLGDPQWGRIQLIDGLAPALRTIRIAKDPQCTACSSAG